MLASVVTPNVRKLPVPDGPMKALRILLPLLFLSLTGICQDSLVMLKDLAFSSSFEKSMFYTHFKNGKSDHFRLFIASGQVMNENAIGQAVNRFDQYVTTLNSEKVLSKKNDKKVKLIYDDVHSAFLKKYELENRFEDIFLNGYYNCVSASALYALVFERLNIPYVIKEKPTHVYLIAYPSQERIIVETTTPAGGFVTINQQFKQSYVKILKDQKLITAQEYGTGNINELFDRFYFGEDHDINLEQLIGIQYSNDGIYHLQNKNSLEAFQQFQKSYLFYPSERASYLMMAALHEVFKARQAKDSVHASTLAILSRFKKYGITSEMIRGEYSNVVQDLLFNKGDKEALQKYHSILMSGTSDKTLKEDLDFYHHFENGRLLYNQARYKEALPYFETCLKIRPGNQEATRIFIASVGESVKNKQTAEGIKSMEEYASKHPMLLENNVFNEMLGTAYLIEMRMSFTSEKAAQGEKIKNTFEQFVAKNPEVIFNPYLIGEAYASAAVYYFKKGNTPKAKAILAKGLELSPNNYELTTRKRMIN
jgi:tetratricopeptide (TPR) repeat protein